MNGNELSSKIESTIKNIFPDCYFKSQYSFLGGQGSLCISFALGKDSSQWKNGIIHNDLAYNNFWIHNAFDADFNQIKELTLEASIIGIRDTKTYKNDKLSWRDIKKGATEEKILKAFQTYFKKLKEKLNESC